MFASTSLFKSVLVCCAFFFFFPFLCHLWNLLNKNNHGNSIVASTPPLRLSFSSPLCSDPLSIHLSIWPSLTARWKLHMQTAVIDWIMCFSGVYAQELCVRRCSFWLTYWLTPWILWQSGRSHAESRTGQESPHLENKHTEQLAQFLV